MCVPNSKNKYSSEPTVSIIKGEERRKNEDGAEKNPKERNSDGFFSVGAQCERQSGTYYAPH